MTTLRDTLDKQRSPAIIFAHVHRRQREIGTGFIDYSEFTVEQFLDLSFINSFFELLAKPYLTSTYAQFEARMSTQVARVKARATLGISDETAYLHDIAGFRAAWTVMFGFGDNIRVFNNENVYNAITEPTSVDAAAA